MVLVQKWPFFELFLFRQYWRGTCVLRYCRTTKTTFYVIKTRSSKSGKIEIFSKGLTHGSGQNVAIFPTFFLVNIGQGNVCYDILERNNDFLGHKNKKLKKSKNWDFSKKSQFCRLFNMFFYSQNRRFFLLAYRATHFLGLFCLK